MVSALPAAISNSTAITAAAASTSVAVAVAEPGGTYLWVEVGSQAAQ